MSLPDDACWNSTHALRAAIAGDLELLACTDAMTPFGHLAPGNPYDAYLPVEPGAAPEPG